MIVLTLAVYFIYGENIMGSENKTTSPGKKTGKKKLLVLAIIIITIPLLLFFLTPVYLSSQSGKNLIVNNINKSIDGIVGIDDLSISWFKGLELTNLTFADNAGTTSAKIKNIRSTPKFSSFIFGNIDLGKTTVTNPDIVLTVRVPTADTAPKKKPAPKPAPTEILTPASIPFNRMKLEIIQGNLTVNLKQPDNSTQSVTLTNIESNVNINPPGTESDFGLTMAVQDSRGASKINASAKLTPDTNTKGWHLKPGSTGQCVVNIDNLDIASLRPLLALAGKDIQVTGNLNANLNAKIANGTLEKLTANADLQNFTQTIGDKTTAFDKPITMDAQVSMKDNLPIIDKLNVTSSFCNVDCAGDKEKITYKAKADLDKLQNFASQFVDLKSFALAGELNINGIAKLAPDNISITGTTKIDKLIVAKTGTKKQTPQTNINATFDMAVDMEKSLISIKTVDIDAGLLVKSATITNATVPFGGETKQPIAGSFKTEIDFKELGPTLEVFGIIPADMQIAGILKSDINASLDGDTLHLDTKETTITNLFIKQDDKPETFQEKLITVKLDTILNIADLTPEKFICKIDGTNIKVDTNIGQTIEGTKTSYAGKANIDVDLENLPPLITARLPEGFIAKGKHPLKANFTTFTDADVKDQSQLKKNLIANADYKFDALSVMGVNFEQTAVKLTAAKGIVSLEPFTANVNGGKLSLAGNIDLNEEPMTFRLTKHTKIADNINITDPIAAKLSYVFPALAKQVGVTGRLDFTADKIVVPLAAESANKIDIIGNIAMRDLGLGAKSFLDPLNSVLKLQHTKIKVSPTDFTIKDGIMRYTDQKDGLQFEFGDKPLNLIGQTGLDKSIDMTIELPWSILGQTATVGKDTQGRIAIPIEGTLDNPKINLAELIKKTTESVIKDVIKGELDNFLKKNKSGSNDKKNDKVEDQINQIINIFK